MADGRRTDRRTRRIAVAAALGVGGSVLSLLPWTLALDESLGLGFLFAVRGPVTAPEEVAVIGISRDSAAAVGQTSELDTWPRELHARLVDRLAAAGAQAIAFDLIFEEPRDAAGDAAFAASLARAGNVVLAERTREEKLPLGNGVEGVLEQRGLPLPELKTRALASAPFVLPAVPMRVHQFWAFGRAATDLPSLPVVALQAHWLPHYEALIRLLEAASPGSAHMLPRTAAEIEAGHALEIVVRSIRAAFERDGALAAAARAKLEQTPLPAGERAALAALVDLYSGSSSRYLNFYGPARALTTMSFDRVLLGAELPDVAGKTVFVGFAEPRQSEQQDDFYSVFSQQSGNNLSGVEVGATAFANLLEGRLLRPLPLPLHALLVLAFGAIVAAVLPNLATGRAAVAALGIGAAYFGAAYWLFASHSVWLPLVVPLLAQLPLCFAAVVRLNYHELARQRERVHTALGHYVPRAVARRIAEQSITANVERQLLHGTCLYTDAEHYTTVSEALRPEELAVLMNDYYKAMFTVVERYGGEISDTAGDSMVAVWASAAPDAAMRKRAADASLAVLAAVDEFNERQRGWRLPTRVGLESGELLLGNVGAEQRYEYRAIGDIVNTAARIQGLNQLLGTRALLSSRTLAGTGLSVRELGTFFVRGKTQPITVHEPLEAGAPDRQAFAEALATFRCGDWDAAEQRFAALVSRHPDDGPSRFYRERAARYRAAPPEAWSGAVNVLGK